MLKGFKIKITNNKLVEMNDLRKDGLYPVDSMDNDNYYIVLENGLQIEIPIQEAQEVPSVTKSVLLG